MTTVPLAGSARVRSSWNQHQPPLVSTTLTESNMGEILPRIAVLGKRLPRDGRRRPGHAPSDVDLVPPCRARTVRRTSSAGRYEVDGDDACGGVRSPASAARPCGLL